MRLFAALVPSVEAVRGLDAALTSARPLAPDLAWTSPDDWHLTFAYFGNISLSDTQRLNVAMRQVACGIRPFDVRVEGIGTYPNPREVIALWAGVEAPEGRLQAVSTSVHDAVKGYGWALDRRIFRPQMLLGRNSIPEDARAFIDQMTGYTGPGWTFDTLVVLQSRPVGDGVVTYDIFDIYPLSAEA